MEVNWDINQTLMGFEFLFLVSRFREIGVPPVIIHVRLGFYIKSTIYFGGTPICKNIHIGNSKNIMEVNGITKEFDKSCDNVRSLV